MAIVQWVVILLADVVFDAAASAQRRFGTEMNRYLDERGYGSRSVTTESPGR
jgi:hypothetical protein